MKTIVTYIIFSVLLGYAAIAMGNGSGGNHDHHSKDNTMKKQHETMTTIFRYWDETQEALKNTDWEMAKRTTGEIEKAAEYIENFKIHKNADKRKQFIEQYNKFIKNIDSLREAISVRDMDSAKTHAEAVQKSCDRCHEKFR